MLVPTEGGDNVHADLSPVIRAYYELPFTSNQAEQVMTEIVRFLSAP